MRVSDVLARPTLSATSSAAGNRLSPLPLTALCLGYFMVILDVTVVTVAIPDIRGSLHVGASGLQWIVDGYTTVFAGLMLLGGDLGDRYGHRRVLIAGLAVFTLASAACAASPSTVALITARLAQGAGAALLVPASLALVHTAYPDRAARAKAFGIWGGVAGSGAATGPVLGGLLVSSFDWRAVFWLNVPVGVIAVILTIRYVPRATKRTDVGRLDTGGQVLGVLALAGLAGALNQAGTAGWTDPVVLVAFAVGISALIWFVGLERRLEAGRGAPLLAPSMFADAGFAATAAIGVLLNVGYYGMLYLSTLYLQQERHYGALGAGVALLPSLGAFVIGAPLSGRLTARIGPYPPMTLGLALGAAGFLGWLAAGPDTPYPRILFALIATGAGTCLTMPAATAAIMETAPPGAAGVASAVFNVCRQVGSTVGVALFGTIAAGSTSLVVGIHRSAVIAAAAFVLGSALAAACLLSVRKAQAMTGTG